METDLLRWMLIAGQSTPKLLEIIKANIQPIYFRTPICRRLYELCLQAETLDFMLFSDCLEKEDDQVILSEIMQRKVNLQKAEEGVIETIRKMLQRQWMEEREVIKAKIHSGKLSEDEVLELAKDFDAIKKKLPEVTLL